MVSLSDSIILRAAGLIGPGVQPPTGICTTTDCLIDMIRTVISTAYAIAGVVTVVFIIMGGYTIIMSTGEPDKMKKGMDTLTYAVIGLVVIVCSSLIFNFVARLLGVEAIVTVLNLPFI